MRILRIASACAVVVGYLWVSVVAYANPAGSVTVVAFPDVPTVYPPIPLNVHAAGSTVTLNWGFPSWTVSAMVRGRVGSPPTDMHDGYLVYQGTATSATDAASFDPDAKVYYRAWGANTSGIWSATHTDAILEATNMLLMILAILALVLMLAGFVLHRYALCIASSAFWIATMAFLYLNYTHTFADIGYIFFWSCIPLLFVCWFEPLIMAGSSKKQLEAGDAVGMFDSERDIDGSDDEDEDTTDFDDESRDNAGGSRRAGRSSRGHRNHKRSAGRKAVSKEWWEEK